jgi:hypothetical protein
VEVPIVKANGLFRGVWLAAGGSHDVLMRYRPPAVVWGALTSLLSLLAGLVLARVSPRQGGTA